MTQQEKLTKQDIDNIHSLIDIGARSIGQNKPLNEAIEIMSVASQLIKKIESLETYNEEVE